MPQGLLASINSAVHSAGQIRDRFSPDGWLALNDLQKTAQRFAKRVRPGDDASHATTVLLRKLAGFSGLVHENMYRFAGWRFLELGRRLERAIQITRIAAWLTNEDAPDGSVEMLLEIGDSVMSHRRRYSVGAGAQSAVDLMILDPDRRVRRRAGCQDSGTSNFLTHEKRDQNHRCKECLVFHG